MAPALERWLAPYTQQGDVPATFATSATSVERLRNSGGFPVATGLRRNATRKAETSAREPGVAVRRTEPATPDASTNIAPRPDVADVADVAGSYPQITPTFGVTPMKSRPPSRNTKVARLEPGPKRWRGSTPAARPAMCHRRGGSDLSTTAAGFWIVGGRPTPRN